MRYKEFVTELELPKFVSNIFKKPETPTPATAPADTTPEIPPGYRLFKLPNGREVAIPAIYNDQQALAALKQKRPDLFTVTTGQAGKQIPATQRLKQAPRSTIPGKVKLEQSQLGSYLEEQAKASGIVGVELAAFLAQCRVETDNFRTLKEYGPSRYFKRYDIKGNPSKARELGNIHPGDGALFRGRGFIQLTGRTNYTNFAKESGIPVDKHPELLEDPATAAKASIWYWKNRVKPVVSNFKNTKQVTRPINSGLKHLSKRAANFKNYHTILASAGSQATTG